MKARTIDLSEAIGVQDAMRRITIVRFAEVLAFAHALDRGRSQDLHNLRIACKRLRYTLERFARFEPSLFEAVTRLTQLQDALGDVHDRDVLALELPKALHKTTHRLREQREGAVDRTRALWHDAFAPFGPFEGLVRFTGLGRSYGFGDGVAAAAVHA